MPALIETLCSNGKNTFLSSVVTNFQEEPGIVSLSPHTHGGADGRFQQALQNFCVAW